VKDKGRQRGVCWRPFFYLIFSSANSFFARRICARKFSSALRCLDLQFRGNIPHKTSPTNIFQCRAPRLMMNGALQFFSSFSIIVGSFIKQLVHRYCGHERFNSAGSQLEES
jgi:hypothetical protein